MKKQTTSWGNVAQWYDELLEEGEGTFQKEVILPNLLRLLKIKKGQKILDLACGQGFFSRSFAQAGAQIVGVDISPELIASAKQRIESEKIANIEFAVGSADHVVGVKNETMDVVTIILALQNIQNVHGTLQECARALKKDGRLLIVLNHPTFRVPKTSSWGWDENNTVQYRRVDAYLSESKLKIDMHPGQKKSVFTTSFHRPLQVYFKSLEKAGFHVSRLEEWISHRKGPRGRKFNASERARKEIPLFMYLEAIKYR